MNENIFAEYLLTQFDLAVRYDYQFYQYKDNYWQKLSDRKLKKLLYRHFNYLVKNAWTAGLQAQYMSTLINLCRDTDELIQGDDYINLKNGLYNLDKWEFQPHNKEVFTPIQIPLSYDPDNEPECPNFIEFLHDIFNNDKELIDLVQEIIGYCLTNSSKAHKLFLFYGNGRNGKSVLADIIEALVGKENTTHIPLKSFNVSFELADIVDKKLNTATENDKLTIKTEMLKSLSAGDPVLINPKHEKPFSHTPTTKLIFAVNRLPHSADTSEGFKDRLCIVPFNNKYTYNPVNSWERMRDPNITEKLMQELDGIFVFALKGLRRLVDNNYQFTRSKEADKILGEYIASINPFADFISTKIIADSNSRIEKTRLHKHFRTWADSQGYTNHASISARAFYLDFEFTLQSMNISCIEKKSSGTRFYQGIKLQ